MADARKVSAQPADARPLAAVKTDELHERLRGVMEGRASAEAHFKEQAAMIQAELDRRVLEEQVAALSPELRAAVVAQEG